MPPDLKGVNSVNQGSLIKIQSDQGLGATQLGSEDHLVGPPSSDIIISGESITAGSTGRNTKSPGTIPTWSGDTKMLILAKNDNPYRQRLAGISSPPPPEPKKPKALDARTQRRNEYLIKKEDGHSYEYIDERTVKRTDQEDGKEIFVTVGETPEEDVFEERFPKGTLSYLYKWEKKLTSEEWEESGRTGKGDKLKLLLTKQVDGEKKEVVLTVNGPKPRKFRPNKDKGNPPPGNQDSGTPVVASAKKQIISGNKTLPDNW